MSSLVKKSTKAVAWNSLLGIFRILVNFTSTIVLSWYVFPTEYGKMAILMGFITLCTPFIDLGFNATLIQSQKVTNKDFSTVFFFNFSVAFLFFFTFYLLSGTISGYYDIPELSLMIKVMSFAILLDSSIFIHRTICMKNLDYKKIAIINMLSLLIGVSTALVLAMNGFGAWSLVVQYVLRSLLNVIFFWFMNPWKPDWFFSFKLLKEHLKFGGWIFGGNVLLKISNNIDKLIIGKVFSPASVAIFNRGKVFSDYPTLMALRIVMKPMFPSISKIQNDIDKLTRAMKMIYHVAFFVFTPIVIFLFLQSENFVLLLLGEKWKGSAFFFQFFLVSGWFGVIKSPSNQLLIGYGKSKLLFLLSATFGGMRIICISIFAFLSLKYLVYGLIAISCVEACTYLYFTTRVIQLSMINVTIYALRYIVISLACSSILIFPIAYFNQIAFLPFFLSGFLIMTSYLFLNYIFKSKGAMMIFSMVFKKIKVSI